MIISFYLFLLKIAIEIIIPIIAKTIII